MTGPQPFVFEPSEDAKRYAPATERNRDAIVRVLRTVLPDQGTVLEIASGTGEHAVHFARAFPGLTWLPSDLDPAGLASIAAWRAEAGLPNLLQGIEIDAGGAWDSVDGPIDAVVCINMVHISPWSATLGLLNGAAMRLPPNAPLYLYGPHRQRGEPTAPSNEAFDVSLKERNPDWGLRWLDDVAAQATAAGLVLASILPMPANNLSVIFRKA